jgi:hypothetical protein
MHRTFGLISPSISLSLSLPSRPPSLPLPFPRSILFLFFILPVLQMAECRGQMLKEQKARHALMLRKERLEAEVIRLRSLHEGEVRSRRAQVPSKLTQRVYSTA